ncbi:DNA topoisomerase I [Halobacteriales archaeon QS_8_69_26]|nr:MAG: DNA topoisomerase I [Halobacteriales archaeon QS_8_69_26]
MNTGVELIVTEKDNAARRIADILSGGDSTVRDAGGVNVYGFEDGRRQVVGLSGHVVGVDFPPEYEDWRAVEPVELIDAEVRKTPTREDIVSTLQSLAREADRVVIATDYDREGELIGKEAYELVREVTDVPVDRVRFSSITEREVTEAFDDPDEIDFDLAAAGEARQVIDLMWGAALTRFLSLSARQLGDDFISVGRVQSPTLRLLVEREREIRAFEPEDYWELFADLSRDGESFEAQYFHREDGTETERLWDGDEAASVEATLREAGTATVSEVRRRTRTDDPPAPFNTTQFIKAAGSLGYAAGRAMSIAEDLYTAGYLTYPRTDNTVYPEDLEPDELLAAFEGHRTLGEDAASLRGDDVEPTRGDTESTDHPPIHPTGEIPDRSELSDDEWEVYELVVRRFFATVADPARWAHLRVVADAGGCSLKANGKRLLEPGYHAVYPYFSTSENYVPDVSEGQRLDVEDVRLAEKQTQPPRRYGQSRLIEVMEDMGIGTKATRHNVLDKLYARGYVEGNPPRPTNLAMAVVDAAEEYAEQIVSEGMTQQLEADMAAIARGEATLEEVTDESREMLREVFEALTESREEVGDHLRESLKADKTLGECPECGDELLVRRSRHGSVFVGCDGFPDCRFTLPLPDKGEPLVLDERCEDHGLRHVKMLAGEDTFVHGCPICADEDAGEGPVIGACPDCGEEHGGELALKTLRNGSRLVGCTRYPDCEYSLPLPRRGEIEVTDDRCAEHDLPELLVQDGDDPWELGCPICNYREYQARQARSNGDLSAIDGIGEKTEAKLADAGVETPEDLAGVDADDLAGRVDGVSADRIREWQSAIEAAAEA